MLRKCGKALKNKKGQIGEIVVVVVLIILAVLGIVKYVMPMFNKNQAMAGAAGGQMDSLAQSAADATYGVVGDEVPAQTIINVWNSTRNLGSDNGIELSICDSGGNPFCSRELEYTQDYGTYKVSAAADAQIDEMATYRISNIERYSNGKPSLIEYSRTLDPAATPSDDDD